jgi:hypothetical protein
MPFPPSSRVRDADVYDRKLLGQLSQCAYQAGKKFFQEVISDKEAVPGVLLFIQTYHIADCGCLQPQSAESAIRTFHFSQVHTGGAYTGFQLRAPLRGARN